MLNYDNWTGDIRDLTSALMQRTNIRKPFRFPIEPGRLTNMLCAFYSVEVQKNGYEIENMESTLGNCREVAEFLSDAGKTKFGLILSGSVGNGKTTMLYALREAIVWVADCKNWNKYLCVTDAREVANNYDRIKDLELLAVDDIGRESAEAMKYGNVINPIADTVSNATFQGADVDWYIKADDIVLKNKGGQPAGNPQNRSSQEQKK